MGAGPECGRIPGVCSQPAGRAPASPHIVFSATLLLDDGGTPPDRGGDVVRTPPGDTHGVTNTGADVLVYLSTTTPPEDVAGFYATSIPS